MATPMVMDETKQFSHESAVCLTNKLLDECRKCQASANDCHILKCVEECEKQKKILQSAGATNCSPLIENWFPTYVQSLIDLTTHKKNALVEEEFPEAKSKEEIENILDDLNQLVKLASSWFLNRQLGDIIGKELEELIYWTSAELLYMFCSTMIERPSCIEKDRLYFLQCCEIGVKHFQLMFGVRQRSENLEEALFNDKNTLDLIKEGAYSDMHVLAMMYCGELCFWHFSHSRDLSELHALSFNSAIIGQKFLSTFVKLVKGPLKDTGWDCTRAESLLSSLNAL